MNALRAILAVIVSYIAMAVIIFAGFSLYFLAIGVDGAYQPGTYEVTFLWIAGSIVISIAAALAGGLVCRKLAKGRKTVIGLVAVVGFLGVMSLVGQIIRSREPIPDRPAGGGRRRGRRGRGVRARPEPG